MFSRLPKEYRHRYTKEKSWDESLVLFVVKIVGSTALFFVIAVGIDVYRLLH